MQLSFEVIKEPWNEYELEDGTIIRSRFILKKVDINKDIQPPQLKIDFQHIASSIASKSSVQGIPSTDTFDPHNPTILNNDEKYSTRLQEWNEYICRDGTRIRVNCTVSNIQRTNKYDTYGDPIFVVNPLINMEVKPPFVNP
jgi:hypothetical protein